MLGWWFGPPWQRSDCERLELLERRANDLRKELEDLENG
jgi:hypothetical protein